MTIGRCHCNSLFVETLCFVVACGDRFSISIFVVTSAIQSLFVVTIGRYHLLVIVCGDHWSLSSASHCLWWPLVAIICQSLFVVTISRCHCNSLFVETLCFVVACGDRFSMSIFVVTIGRCHCESLFVVSQFVVCGEHRWLWTLSLHLIVMVTYHMTLKAMLWIQRSHKTASVEIYP